MAHVKNTSKEARKAVRAVQKGAYYQLDLGVDCRCLKHRKFEYTFKVEPIESTGRLDIGV